MHQEILDKKQKEMVPFLGGFSEDFGLAGGTAIALHIGHRRSIDFDLMTVKEFRTVDIQKKIMKSKKIESVSVDQEGEYTVLIGGIRITFLHYPFPISFTEELEGIRMADLLTLSALKAYALGRRAKWKDYVDLYFIMKDFVIGDIIKKAEEIFGNSFNEKIFRTQLSYFKDIDYSEKLEYLPGFEVSDEVIKKELAEKSLA